MLMIKLLYVEILLICKYSAKTIKLYKILTISKRAILP